MSSSHQPWVAELDDPPPDQPALRGLVWSGWQQFGVPAFTVEAEAFGFSTGEFAIEKVATLPEEWQGRLRVRRRKGGQGP